jgi:hypothetical protein
MVMLGTQNGNDSDMLKPCMGCKREMIGICKGQVGHNIMTRQFFVEYAWSMLDFLGASPLEPAHVIGEVCMYVP